MELTHEIGSSGMDKSQFNQGQIPALYKRSLFSGHWGLIHLVKELGKLVGEVLFVLFVGLEHSDWVSQKLVLLAMNGMFSPLSCSLGSWGQISFQMIPGWLGCGI